MSNAAAIEMEAAMYGPGVSFRMVCPECDGGVSHERSLSVTVGDDGVALFKCHRASCEYSGATRGGGSLIRIRQPERPPQRLMEHAPLTQTHLDRIYALWMLDYVLCENVGHFRWDLVSNRLAMPMFTHQSTIAGWVLRALYGEQPKTLNVMEPGGVPASFYGDRRDTTTLYIVEDIPSAVRLSRYGQSLALCGTYLSGDIAAHLRRANYDTLWIALDPDATRTAIRMKGELAPFVPDCRVQVLPTDVKNMEEPRIKELDMVRLKHGST
jgi:hypothetical protein